MVSSEISIPKPDEADIKHEYSHIVQAADDLTISNIDDHQYALQCLKQVRQANKRVKERMDPAINAAHKAHKAMTTLRKELLEPILLADDIINGKLGLYEAEQRRIAEAKQKEAEEAARNIEEERRIAEAIAVEADGGDPDEVLAQPIEAPHIQVVPEIAKVQGISERTTYGVEVMDLVLLAEYVCKNPEWLNLIEPNMKALNGLARSQQENMKVPGVKVVKKVGRSVRTG